MPNRWNFKKTKSSQVLKNQKYRKTMKASREKWQIYRGTTIPITVIFLSKNTETKRQWNSIFISARSKRLSNQNHTFRENIFRESR